MESSHVKREFTLQYLWECRYGDDHRKRRRNVPLQLTAGAHRRGATEDGFGNFPYLNAHRLEHRDPNSVSGIWGISHWRCEKLFGNIEQPLWPQSIRFEDISADLWAKAKLFRKFCYHRVTSADEAIRLLNANREVRFAFEITSDWYDPPQGIIPPLPEKPEFIESHAVSIAAFDPERQRFIFPNSWGPDWGYYGLGQFPKEDWDRKIVSAWETFGADRAVPVTNKSGIIVRGWKWGFELSSGVHGIEIYDVDNDENIAWAFCIVRDGILDIDEFFVHPEYRGRGFANELSKHVKYLAKSMSKTIRLIVGFADTEDYSIDGALAVARLFDVTLIEADVRWASMFGTANAITRPSRNWKPRRPASVLENLRPRSEPPSTDPRQYNVFYGTNRKPIDPLDHSKGFRNERDYALHQGSCLVEIPTTHRFGSVGRRWWHMLTRAEKNVLRIVGIHHLSPEDLIKFAQYLISKHDGEGKPHNLLYIHGYNCTFEDSAKTAAQLGADLKVTGTTFCYTWPSMASGDGYLADEATIETSVEYCLEFVKNLLGAFPDIPLHIVAHSMGNRLALNVLEKLAATDNLHGELGQCIFAAADVDVDRFKLGVPIIRPLAKRLTSYVSRGDLALQLSEKLHKFPRVGLAPPILRVDGVDTILSEDFAISEVVGHGYYAEAAPILSDIFFLLRHGSNPDDRPRTKREVDSTSSIPFWSIAVQ